MNKYEGIKVKELVEKVYAKSIIDMLRFAKIQNAYTCSIL